MNEKILISGAHIVDPAERLNGVADVLLENGVISAIGSALKENGARKVNAKGLYLFPGLVDLHTHFREPGFEHKETIASGAAAARAGGFVGCVSMPNTKPACDSAGVVEIILKKALDAHFTIFPCGTITQGREGKELSEMADLKSAGCIGVSDDGDSVADALLMRRAMEYASMLKLLVMIHAEDKQLSKSGFMNESLVSTKMGLRGIPNAAEDVIVARDLELARLTGAPVHFQHVSTARAVRLIDEAKREGVAVTAEVTPHHIALIDEDITSYDTNFKMNPPLRSRKDREALIDGLKRGVIDAIATDHAPHQGIEKDVEFDRAPYGTLGLETALAVSLTYLYHTAHLSLEDIVRKLSTNPQAIIGVRDFATIKTGIFGNFCLVDIAKEWTVDPAHLQSKSRNTCFAGRTLKGKVVATVAKGVYYSFA